MRRAGPDTGLAQWWRQPDRYDWLLQLIDSSGYGLLTRLGIAGGCAAIGMWPILMVFSPQGVTGSSQQIVTVGFGALALIYSTVWLRGWPTHTQSRIIVVTLNLTIAINCMLYILDGKPVTGTLAFSLTASYVACVHTLPHLTVVWVLASTPIVTRMVIEGLAGDPTDGVADGALRLASVIVVPMTLRILVQLLGDAAVMSDIDPLTGLANRRGLVRAVSQLVGAAVAGGRTQLSMTVIDIDHFKTINDTHGHTAGDHVLVALAKQLHRVCPDQSVIARIGGEEFAVVVIGDTDTAQRIADQLRVEFRTAPVGFTASFGIAGSTLALDVPVDTIELTEQLLDAADQAMYVAKRAGGDDVEVSR